MRRHTRESHGAGATDTIGTRAAGPLTDAPGAYLLVIELDRDLTVRLGGGPETVLKPGRYGYCGSARGPGGLAARVRRHLRDGRRPHWHVDRLTEAGKIVDVRLLPGGSECGLLRALLARGDVSVPVPGFGSSDCRHCPAHLVSLPDAFEARTAGLAGPQAAAAADFDGRPPRWKRERKA